MQENELVNANDVRIELDEKIKQDCRNILEELFALYEQTNPAKGKETEKDKNLKATDALIKIGILAETLTSWAEDHVLGLHHLKHKYQSKKFSKQNSDKHENEIQIYEEDIFEYACGCNLCKECFESSVKVKREAINRILHYTSGIHNPSTWRLILIDGIKALNNGQVNWIMRPIQTNKQGNSHDAIEVKKAAVKHVYILMGQGHAKYSAQEYIIEKDYGIKRESLRKWEKQLLKDNFLKKKDLENIKNGSAFIHKNIDNKNDIIISAKRIMAKSRTNKYTEAALYFKNLLHNEPIPKHIRFTFPVDLAWGILASQSITIGFPLSDLKERLAFASGSIEEMV